MVGNELIEYENNKVSKLQGDSLEKYLQEQMQIMREINIKLVANGRKEAFTDLNSCALSTMVIRNDDGTYKIAKREKPILRSVFGVPSVAPPSSESIANKRTGKYNDADLLIVGEAQNIEFKEIGSFTGIYNN